MSQTATARPLRAPRRSAPVVPLRVLPNRLVSGGGGAFAAICVVILGTGLITVLLLNTMLAQGALELSALQRENSQLQDTASNLREDVAKASSASALAQRAGELGMVRQNERGYIDLATGKVTGESQPATGQQRVPIVVGPSRYLNAGGTPVAATPKKVDKPSSTTEALRLGAIQTRPTDGVGVLVVGGRAAPAPGATSTKPGDAKPGTPKPSTTKPTTTKPSTTKPSTTKPGAGAPADQTKPE